MGSLTKEQQDLVERNHQLIYGFASKYKIDPEENYDILAIGLCNAALTFDRTRGYSFSTLAYKCMLNEICRIKRDDKRVKEIPKYAIVPFAEIHPNSDELTQGNYLDSNSIVTDFVSGLTKNEQIVFKYLYNQMTYRDIGNIMGCSCENIRRTKERIKKKWKKYNA
jgi:RNA polymerase sigma factor (sigma-70 family)